MTNTKWSNKISSEFKTVSVLTALILKGINAEI